MSGEPLGDELVGLLTGRAGHFRLESGHHGELWLDLDRLFLRPASLRRFAVELAARLSPHGPDAVCGPLVGGGFLALLVAAELDVDFYPAERIARSSADGLYPVRYRIPDGLRGRVGGRRVAVVDDVINAGSAVRGVVADVRACGGRPVAIGALLVLGRSAVGEDVPLEGLAHRPSRVWEPSDCPLCASGVPLEDPTVSSRS
jgi:orotate phosphoribosyltransferase